MDKRRQDRIIGSTAADILADHPHVGQDANDMAGLGDGAAGNIHQVEAIIVLAQFVQRVGVGVNLDSADAWLRHPVPPLLCVVSCEGSTARLRPLYYNLIEG